jgi:hypothetical protein
MRYLVISDAAIRLSTVGYRTPHSWCPPLADTKRSVANALNSVQSVGPSSAELTVLLQ